MCVRIHDSAQLLHLSMTVKNVSFCSFRSIHFLARLHVKSNMIIYMLTLKRVLAGWLAFAAVILVVRTLFEFVFCFFQKKKKNFLRISGYIQYLILC